MRPLQWLRAFFRPAPAAPPIEDPAVAARLLWRWRWSAFLSITLGYGLYYMVRLPLSVAKKPMLDEAVMSASELGRVGAALLATYALGKTLNGFLADRVHTGRFFATALAASGLVNVAFGATSTVGWFVALWALNGWFQSCGAPASGTTLAAWYAPQQRGTLYGIWSVSHSLGEAFTFVATAVLVEQAGWRWGFIGPGLFCAGAAFLLYATLPDRPASRGLVAREDAAETTDVAGSAAASANVNAAQLRVLLNGRVWVLGLASACMYVARYAVNNWGVLYLQIDKGYALTAASAVVAIFPVMGVVGSIASGLLSDRLFRGERTAPTVWFCVLMVASLVALFGPAGESPLVAKLAMGGAGFAIGGLLVYLGGLAAMDTADPRAAGAALGIVGGMSYVGASLQDWTSGHLIETSKTVVDGVTRYDFGPAQVVWLGAAFTCLALSIGLWVWERVLGRGPKH